MTAGVPSSRRILLVEDNDQTRELLRMVLEESGHTVEEADDGLDGVTKAVAWKPDVVLMDIEMPVFDGYGVARRVREALGQGRDQRVLLDPALQLPHPEANEQRTAEVAGSLRALVLALIADENDRTTEAMSRFWSVAL